MESSPTRVGSRSGSRISQGPNTTTGNHHHHARTQTNHPTPQAIKSADVAKNVAASTPVSRDQINELTATTRQAGNK